MKEKRKMDERINKIAEDVAYMRAKIEVIPAMREDIDELKRAKDKSLGFLAGVSVLCGGLGAYITKFINVIGSHG